MDQQFVSNQTAPQTNSTFPVQNVLKSFPQFIKCPMCGVVAPTIAQRKFNVCNCCCYLFLSPCWIINAICKEKDLNCYDANHICMNCQRPVAKYSAC